MSNEGFEIKLLDDYLQATLQEHDYSRVREQLAVYEKQLALCKSHSFNFNVKWYEAMVYYIKAEKKLNVAFWPLDDDSGTIEKAIVSLDQAIAIYPDYALFWFKRADLNREIGHKKAGLRDINHVLTEFNNDETFYLEARKLKDKIEILPDSACFIATAVYETPYSPELTVLRNFRDQVLLDSSVGKAVVSCYYMISPSIARRLSKSRRAKLVVRVALLDPFVALLNRNRRNDHG